MIPLADIGARLASARRERGLTQSQLAVIAQVSRPTIVLLENGRATELGYSKLVRLLAAVGLEFRIERAGNRRPTLDDLLREDADR